MGVTERSRREKHEPHFAPQSGWYKPGIMTPGSLRDREEMREASIPYSVVVLRRRGARIPATELLRCEPATGRLICMDQYTAPAWYACLFADGQMQREILPRLLHVQLERENGGVRLYGGIEVDRHEQWRQAWLCTPTPERAGQILLEMLEQQGGF